MVRDLAPFADHLSPERPFILAGHDWGASIAYAYAFAHPDRLTHLIVANGVHPVPFQRAILDDPEQRQASQYINLLRQPDAEAWLSDNDFAGDVQDARRLLGHRLDAQGAALRLYRSVVAAGRHEGDARLVPRLAAGRARTRRDRRARRRSSTCRPTCLPSAMPHLVVWGEDDRALLPSCLTGLEAIRARPDDPQNPRLRPLAAA